MREIQTIKGHMSLTHNIPASWDLLLRWIIAKATGELITLVIRTEEINIFANNATYSNDIN